MENIQLVLSHIVSETKGAPSADQRRRLNKTLVSYQGSDGYEYRKQFESYGTPEIPTAGGNREITAKQKQF